MASVENPEWARFLQTERDPVKLAMFARERANEARAEAERAQDLINKLRTIRDA